DRGGYARFIGRSRGWTRFGVERGHLVSRALDRGRFREAFHRELPGSRPDFRGHVGTVARGRSITEHERINGHERVTEHTRITEHERAGIHGNEGAHGLHTAGFSRGGGGSMGG